MDRTREVTMTKKAFGVIALVALMAGLASCARPYGYDFYPDVPRFRPTNPRSVALLRREPRQAHLRLGEVWMRPEPRMRRAYVEGVLREQAARMGGDALVIVVDRFFREPVWDRGYRRGYFRERQIVGIAIRYRRR